MTMRKISYEFTHAISRLPSAAAVDGLRAVDTGTPDPALMRQHHAQYIAALQEAGVKVNVLPALDQFPDAQFVEDTALCLPDLAILMRPGAPSRLGEVAEMKPHLSKLYDHIEEIAAPAHIEGGDILLTEREILVGLSERTTTEGVDALRQITEPHGRKIRIVDTPKGVLHFKTDCSLLDEDTILSTRRLDASGCFEGYRVLHVPDGEEAAANTIRVNNLVLMPDGFPKTAEMLSAAGYDIRQIGNSECAKIDGGMSCLSLRF